MRLCGKHIGAVLGINDSMNWVFGLLTLVGVAVLGFLQPQSMTDTLLAGTSKAVGLCLRLVSVYALWMGLLQIAEESGVSDKVAKLYNPLLNRLFRAESPRARTLIGLNLTANLLGLGAAATPLGIAAVESMSHGEEKATDGMILFFVLNVTAVQLLPTTLVSLRASHGSVNPSDIILPSLVASSCTAVCGVVLVFLCRLVARKIGGRTPKKHTKAT